LLAWFVLAAVAACGKSERSGERRQRGASGGSAPNGGATGGGVTSGGATSGGATTGGATSGGAGASNAGNPATGGTGGDAAGAAGSGGDPEGGEGGEPPDPPCDDGAVRCLAGVGTRERCVAGDWVSEDFVCAVSVRVENGSGYPCATKADGRFKCWLNDASDLLPPAPVLPGLVRQTLGGQGLPLFWNGTLFLLEDGTLYRSGPILVGTNVAFFDRDYHSMDTCVVLRDGGGICQATPLSMLTPSGTVGFRQVLMSSADVCTLDTLGVVRCTRSMLSGRYAELALGNVACARTLDGAIECAWPDAPLFEVPAGTFKRIAMADDTVCGIRDTGELACAGVEGQSPDPPAGAFTDIDAGDRTICAIHLDGSVRCQSSFEGAAAHEVPEGW
jgi:hypothetical protein